MHTAAQLFTADFDVRIDGRHVGVAGLFPDWDARDRFGLVVDGVLDAIGASLLTQAAIASHYDFRPARRGPKPAYPEIYVFHVGGAKGDHSNYDFWPPRKEVVLPTRSPNALLTEINARGITRLAVPNVAPASLETLQDGPSTWAEQYSARDRIASCFAYSASGRVTGGDVTINANDPRIEQNIYSTLHPLEAARAALAGNEDFAYSEGSAPSLPADVLAGTAEDVRRWVAKVEARVHEVAPERMRELVAERAAKVADAGGTPEETYRRLTIEQALGVLASFAQGA